LRNLLTAGFLDPEFGANGKVLTHFKGDFDYGADVALQADGKIVVAGSTLSGGGGDNFALARYLPNGDLDTSFSFDGRVATDFAGRYDSAQAVAIQSDGKIIAAGIGTETIGGVFVRVFAVARYKPDGGLDATFGAGGKVMTRIGESDLASDIAIQADGKIVVVGQTLTEFGDDDFAVVRYNSDGTLDEDFDADGKAAADFGARNDSANAVAIQPDGKIVVVGQMERQTVAGALEKGFGLARFTIDGELDTSFHSNGITSTEFTEGIDIAQDVAIQADGRIVVAGSGDSEGDGQFALARYLPHGEPDSDFDADGQVLTDFGGGPFDGATAVAIQSNGKIVAAGWGSSGGGGSNFALARYLPDGALDTSFSVDGKTTNDLAGPDDGDLVVIQPDGRVITAGDDGVNGVVIQSDGKIIAAGFAFTGDDSDFALARYLGDSPSNQPPIAEANGDYIVAEGGAVQLSSAGSTDPDGSIVQFAWDLDYDGVTFDAVHVGASPVFSAVELEGPLTLTVALMVTDDDGATALDTATITVFGDPVEQPNQATSAEPQDLNRDGVVAIADVLVLCHHLRALESSSQADRSLDLNGDGLLSVADLVVLVIALLEVVHDLAEGESDGAEPYFDATDEENRDALFADEVERRQVWENY
jgi:uncharacterized delta-60 repeat protein